MSIIEVTMLSTSRGAWILAATLAGTATSAVAATWGVGAAAGTRPALSVQMRPRPDVAYHVTSHLSADRVAMTGDLQRHVTPSFGYGRGWRLSFYGGAGVEGLSQRRGGGEEEYRLRLPIGTQADILAAATVGFFEVAATVGPVPATSADGQALLGLRAAF